jgi:putative ABC transport system permease protein
MAIKTERDPTAFITAVHREIAAIDPDLPVSEFFTLEKVFSDQVLGLSYVAVMLTVMGIIALVLAGVGVYGVMAYSVAERTPEIGVRVAMGAQPRDVLRLIMSRGILITSVGLLIGAHRLAACVGFGAVDGKPYLWRERRRRDHLRAYYSAHGGNHSDRLLRAHA